MFADRNGITYAPRDPVFALATAGSVSFDIPNVKDRFTEGDISWATTVLNEADRQLNNVTIVFTCFRKKGGGSATLVSPSLSGIREP